MDFNICVEKSLDLEDKEQFQEYFEMIEPFEISPGTLPDLISSNSESISRNTETNVLGTDTKIPELEDPQSIHSNNNTVSQNSLSRDDRVYYPYLNDLHERILDVQRGNEQYLDKPPTNDDVSIFIQNGENKYYSDSFWNNFVNQVNSDFPNLTNNINTNVTNDQNERHNALSRIVLKMYNPWMVENGNKMNFVGDYFSYNPLYTSVLDTTHQNNVQSYLDTNNIILDLSSFTSYPVQYNLPSDDNKSDKVFNDLWSIVQSQSNIYDRSSGESFLQNNNIQTKQDFYNLPTYVKPYVVWQLSNILNFDPLPDNARYTKAYHDNRINNQIKELTVDSESKFVDNVSQFGDVDFSRWLYEIFTQNNPDVHTNSIGNYILYSMSPEEMKLYYDQYKNSNNNQPNNSTIYLAGHNVYDRYPYRYDGESVPTIYTDFFDTLDNLENVTREDVCDIISDTNTQIQNEKYWASNPPFMYKYLTENEAYDYINAPSIEEKERIKNEIYSTFLYNPNTSMVNYVDSIYGQERKLDSSHFPAESNILNDVVDPQSNTGSGLLNSNSSLPSVNLLSTGTKDLTDNDHNSTSILGVSGYAALPTLNAVQPLEFPSNKIQSKINSRRESDSIFQPNEIFLQNLTSEYKSQFKDVFDDLKSSENTSDSTRDNIRNNNNRSDRKSTNNRRNINRKSTNNRRNINRKSTNNRRNINRKRTNNRRNTTVTNRSKISKETNWTNDKKKTLVNTYKEKQLKYNQELFEELAFLFNTNVQDIKKQLNSISPNLNIQENFKTNWSCNNNVRARNSRRFKTLLSRNKEFISCDEYACIFNISNEDMNRILQSQQEKTNHNIIEGFERPSANDLIRRLRHFVDEEIIVLLHPKLNLIDSIIEKKFFIKKITVSFVDSNKAKWKSINNRAKDKDQQGNYIQYDPLQKRLESNSASPEEIVKTIIKERIEPLTTIKFEFITDDDNTTLNTTDAVVRVGFEPNGGNWSLVGMYNLFSSANTTMNLGSFDVATIIHEFMHVLGLLHEHQLSFGDPIQWNKPLLYSWANRVYGWDKKVVDKNIIEKYNKNQINGTKFDPKSIMLYYFPKELTLDGKGTSQNKRLSETDIKYALTMFGVDKKKDWRNIYKQMYGIYPKETSTKTIPTNDENSIIDKYKMLILLVLVFLVLIFRSRLSKKTFSILLLVLLSLILINI